MESKTVVESVEIIEPDVQPIQPELISKRSMWSGTMGIGLININVNMINMENDKSVKFHQIHKTDNKRITLKKFCTGENIEVPKNEIVKGYEIEPGKYITFDESEIDAVRSQSDKMIHIDKFVEYLTLDPVYFNTSYILVPDKNRTAYDLMYVALSQSMKVGIGKITIRTKEFPVVVRPYRGSLILTTLRYSDEIIKPENLIQFQIEQPTSLKEAEIGLAVQIINNLSGNFDLNDYKDTTRNKILELIKMKQNGEPIGEPILIQDPALPSLMDQLTATLESTKR